MRFRRFKLHWQVVDRLMVIAVDVGVQHTAAVLRLDAVSQFGGQRLRLVDAGKIAGRIPHRHGAGPARDDPANPRLDLHREQPGQIARASGDGAPNPLRCGGQHRLALKIQSLCHFSIYSNS